MVDVNVICNHNVATIGKNAGVADAALLMRTEHVGVIAVDDIIEHLAEQLSRLAELLRLEREAEPRKRP